MSNLVFILFALTIPFLSIGLVAVVFSGLSIGIAVTLTIFVFLLLSCGCYYLSSAWQKTIRGPAKAREYEATLLSEMSDSGGMIGLDISYVFGLGIFGHIVFFIGIAGIILMPSKDEPVSILIGKGLTVLVLILLGKH